MTFAQILNTNFRKLQANQNLSMEPSSNAALMANIQHMREENKMFQYGKYKNIKWWV